MVSGMGMSVVNTEWFQEWVCQCGLRGGCVSGKYKVVSGVGVSVVKTEWFQGWVCR